ncbi:hypothetical protein TRVL_01225 [Trypanosoma vivax]|nr:hypothetical protein TRVL_01225 [Trypanosoma vivax]
MSTESVITSRRLEEFLKENLTDTMAESLQHWGERLASFAQRVVDGHCRGIALVTSGGTAVSLEVTAVRYLVNFSSGGRGAGLAEQLLQRGWACILLHSESASLPFRRHIDGLGITEFFRELTLGRHSSSVESVLVAYEKYRENLFLVPFHSAAEYLYLLRLLTNTLCRKVDCLQRLPMILFTAAAVTDYYVPRSRMPEHKISGGDHLTLHLDTVPKILGLISEEWHRESSDCPRYLISFKLETDEEELRRKAVNNLLNYKCDAVVANLRQSYREKVWVYWLADAEPEELLRPEDRSIEALILDRILDRLQLNVCDAMSTGPEGA